MILLAGSLVIVVAVWAIVRGGEVRLTLLLSALLLGCLAGQPDALVRTFLTTLVSERFVLPIACSLGFAYVLRQTECDRDLVLLLLKPIRHIRPLLLPGTVIVGVLVNVPVVSQMSTAILVGTVLVPLLRAARFSPATIGSALLLGCSLGGDLLNPGAPEARSVSEATATVFSSPRWIAQVLPLLAVELGVATLLFWLLSLRVEARFLKEAESRSDADAGQRESDSPEQIAPSRIHPVKALVPFVPIVLLFITSLPEPFRVISVPKDWLVDVAHFEGKQSELQASFDCRLIGAAMLIGVVVAALTSRKCVAQTARTFFEGVGYAFTNIISLIVGASCFGEGVKRIGLAALLGRLLETWPSLLSPAAVGLPLSFAFLCGSGMATTQSLFAFFVEPAHQLGYDPLRLGAVVALAASAGRTLSPVAAVTLMCATMVDVPPMQLVRRLTLPLLGGILAVLAASHLLL
jgi:DcuC family C4-dicarboxylate transporter